MNILKYEMIQKMKTKKKHKLKEKIEQETFKLPIGTNQCLYRLKYLKLYTLPRPVEVSPSQSSIPSG